MICTHPWVCYHTGSGRHTLGLAAARMDVRALSWQMMPALAIDRVCCSITSCSMDLHNKKYSNWYPYNHLVISVLRIWTRNTPWSVYVYYTVHILYSRILIRNNKDLVPTIYLLVQNIIFEGLKNPTKHWQMKTNLYFDFIFISSFLLCERFWVLVECGSKYANWCNRNRIRGCAFKPT